MNQLSMHIRNQKGFTLLEMMISMVIMIIVLGGSIKVFTYQQSLIRDENDTAKVRAKGRHAIKMLAREVRMAGYGLPPTLGVTDMTTANTIKFRVNLENVRTFIDSSVDAPSGNPTITVTDATGFTNGDDVVLYNPNTEKNDYLTIQSISGNLITFTSSLDNDYIFSPFNMITSVNKYNEYTVRLLSYTFNGDTRYQIEKEIDGAKIVLINDLASSTGMTFDYFDFEGNTATTTFDVQQVAITLNMEDPRNPDATMEFKTDVQIRNSDL